jgi:flagellar assembly factor FliW
LQSWACAWTWFQTKKQNSSLLGGIVLRLQNVSMILASPFCVEKYDPNVTHMGNSILLPDAYAF